MFPSQIDDFLTNIALILILIIFYSFSFDTKFRDKLTGKIYVGVLFGGAAVLAMLVPFRLEPGIQFDSRSVVLSLAGLFTGPITAGVAGLIALVYRIFIGGAGMLTGVGSIVISVGLGLAYRRFQKKNLTDISALHLLGFAVVVHLILLVWFFTLPDPLPTLRVIALPYLVIFSLGTAVGGVLLRVHLRSTETRRVLAYSEEVYRNYFQEAPYAIFVANANKQYIDVNHAACEMTGYTEEELLNMSISDLLVPESLPGLEERFAVILEKASTQTLSTCLKKDGTKFLMALNIVNLGEGRVIAFCRDVSTFQNTVVELQDQEQKLDVILKNAQPIIFMMDKHGTFLISEGASLGAIGLKPGEAVGQNVFELYADYPEIIEKLQHGLDGHYARYVLDFPEGRYFDTSLSPYFSHDGNVAGLIGMAIEVTDAVKSEMALRASEEKFSSLVNSMDDVIFTLDTKQRHTGVYGRWLNASGLGEEDFLGKTSTDIFGEDAGEIHRAANQRALQGERVVYEWSTAAPDGQVQYYQTALSPMFDEQEEVIGLVGVGREITALKQYEDLIHEMNEELEDRVDQRTRELQEAIKELEAFSYSVSHDLRAPLRAISGFSELLLVDKADVLDDESKQYLARMSESGRKMDQLIKGLLQLSHLGRQDLEEKTFNISELTASILDDLLSEETGREFELDIQPDLMVLADRSLVSIMLYNLLSNAIKFTDLDRTARIEFGRHEVDGEIVYYLKDNGIGFDQDYQGKIFQPFYRLHTEGEFSGTGIGLAIVNRVVERHGGRIWVEASPDEGAAFYFNLPQSE